MSFCRLRICHLSASPAPQGKHVSRCLSFFSSAHPFAHLMKNITLDALVIPPHHCPPSPLYMTGRGLTAASLCLFVSACFGSPRRGETDLRSGEFMLHGCAGNQKAASLSEVRPRLLSFFFSFPGCSPQSVSGFESLSLIYELRRRSTGGPRRYESPARSSFRHP